MRGLSRHLIVPPRSSLMAQNARALARIEDPRRRRERAYALLAHNGFDPETCREVAAKAANPNEELDPVFPT